MNSEYYEHYCYEHFLRILRNYYDSYYEYTYSYYELRWPLLLKIYLSCYEYYENCYIAYPVMNITLFGVLLPALLLALDDKDQQSSAEGILFDEI